MKGKIDSEPGGREKLTHDFKYAEIPGHLIRRIHQIAVSIISEQMRKVGYDLTSVQHAALTAIDQFPGIVQATLASTIAYDRATIGGVVDRLEQKHLIRRDTMPGDQRAKRLFVEEAGTEALRRLEPAVHEAQDLMLNGLTEVERRLLVHLLRKLADAQNEKSRAPMRPISDTLMEKMRQADAIAKLGARHAIQRSRSSSGRASKRSATSP